MLHRLLLTRDPPAVQLQVTAVVQETVRAALEHLQRRRSHKGQALTCYMFTLVRTRINKNLIELLDYVTVDASVVWFRQRRGRRGRLPAVPRGRRRHGRAGPRQVSGVCSHGAARFHPGTPHTPAKQPRERVAQPRAAQASATPRRKCTPRGEHGFHPGRTAFALLSCR